MDSEGELMKNAGAYAKSLIPLLITALYSIQSALSDGRVTNTEWAGIATGLLASLGAFLVPNTPKPTVTFNSPNISYKPPVAVVQMIDDPSTPTTEPAPPVL